MNKLLIIFALLNNKFQNELENWSGHLYLVNHTD